MAQRELVKRAKSGDKEALIQLIVTQKKDYYKLAYVYMGNKEDALDAVSDMIVVLYTQINRLRKEEAFDSWSRTILVNCCKKNLGKRSRTLLVEDLETQHYQEKYDVRELRFDLDEGMKMLNKDQQEAIKLRYFMDWDYQSISRATHVPEGTVKSRISIGLRKLKACFGGEY